MPQPRAEWASQLQFLQRCSELDSGGIPAGHNTKLAPLFAHPQDQPIPLGPLVSELEAAVEGMEALQAEAVAPVPLSCMRKPQSAEALPARGKRIGARVGATGPREARGQGRGQACNLLLVGRYLPGMRLTYLVSWGRGASVCAAEALWGAACGQGAQVHPVGVHAGGGGYAWSHR